MQRIYISHRNGCTSRVRQGGYVGQRCRLLGSPWSHFRYDAWYGYGWGRRISNQCTPTPPLSLFSPNPGSTKCYLLGPYSAISTITPVIPVPERDRSFTWQCTGCLRFSVNGACLSLHTSCKLPRQIASKKLDSTQRLTDHLAEVFERRKSPEIWYNWQHYISVSFEVALLVKNY